MGVVTCDTPHVSCHITACHAVQAQRETWGNGGEVKRSKIVFLWQVSDQESSVASEAAADKKLFFIDHMEALCCSWAVQSQGRDYVILPDILSCDLLFKGLNWYYSSNTGELTFAFIFFLSLFFFLFFHFFCMFFSNLAGLDEWMD